MPGARRRPVPPPQPVLPPIKWHAPIAYGVVALLGARRLRPARHRPASTARSPISTPKRLHPVHAVLGAVEADRDHPVPRSRSASPGVSFYEPRRARRRPASGCRSPTACLMVFAFLVWAVAGKDSALPLTGLLQGSLFLAIPLVFGALAGLLCERVRHHQHRHRGPAARRRVPRGRRRHPDRQRLRGPDRRARRRCARRAAAGAVRRSSTWSTRSSSASCSTCWSSA